MKQHLLTRQISANTLPEVLMSLALIGLAFALGTQLILNFTGPNSPPERNRSHLLAEAWLNESLGPHLNYLESRQVEGRRLERHLRLLEPTSNLVRIEVKVFVDDHQVLSCWRYTFWDQESMAYEY